MDRACSGSFGTLVGLKDSNSEKISKSGRRLNSIPIEILLNIIFLGKKKKNIFFAKMRNLHRYRFKPPCKELQGNSLNSLTHGRVWGCVRDSFQGSLDLSELLHMLE